MTDIADMSTTTDFLLQPVADRLEINAALAAKRTFDVVIAAVLIVVLLPLCLLVAIAVKTTSSGPVFFRHRRVGRFGDSFELLKFRTMSDDAFERILSDEALYADYVANDFKLPGAAFVTPLGRFLRKTSIDELPQLLHVFTGKMSLVGVRPVEAAQLAQRDSISREAYLAMRPGLTGLWQVGGRSSLTPDERCHLDTRYVEQWNVLEDLSILVRTPAAVLRFNETN